MEFPDTKRQPLRQLNENVYNTRSRAVDTKLDYVQKFRKSEFEKKRSTSDVTCVHKTIKAMCKKVSSDEAVGTDVQKTQATPVEDELLLYPDDPLPKGVLDIDDRKRDELCPYIKQIYTYLRRQEEHFIVPTDFMNKKRISPWMRSMLVEWLIEVQVYQGLLSETLHLSVAISDCYLAMQNIDAKRIQLLGTGAIFIAAKFVERFPPTADRLCYFTDDSYQPIELLQMEQTILKILEFQINLPLPLHFLQRCLNACPDLEYAEMRTIRLFSLYLFEQLLVEHYISTILPSLRAAAAVFLGRTIFCPQRPASTPTFLYYVSYTEEELLPCVCTYLKVLYKLLVGDFKFTAAKTKFNKGKYGEIAAHPCIQNLERIKFLLKDFSARLKP